ncbi:MAG: hypothetical protein ACLFPO_13275 [Spirochaetaceae bacterium]
MFNIGKTDQYGRQKRIEHRGKYLRASRTGGVSLRAQTKAAGLTVTGNTKRGIRVSTRVAKGTNVALQNGRFRLRGRYGRGPTKLNLSKSGASVSTRNALGTFNWTNPNRSSAKIAGVQMRGKKAANLQMIYLLVMLVVNLVKLAAMLLVWIAQALLIIGRAAWIGAVSGTQALLELGRTLRARRLARAGENKIARAGLDDRLRDASALRSALHSVVTAWGRGLSAEELDRLITPGTPRVEAKQMRQVTAALAARYAAAASAQEIGETLLSLDEAARADGKRTVLQDRLIDAFADRAKPVFEPAGGDTGDDSGLTTNA